MILNIIPDRGHAPPLILMIRNSLNPVEHWAHSYYSVAYSSPTFYRPAAQSVYNFSIHVLFRSQSSSLTSITSSILVFQFYRTLLCVLTIFFNSPSVLTDYFSPLPPHNDIAVITISCQTSSVITWCS